MFVIQLWLAAVVFVIAAAGFIAIIGLARRKAKKKWLVAGAISLSVIMLALLMYILLTFVFLDAIGAQPPDALSEAPALTEAPRMDAGIPPADEPIVPVFYPFEPYAVDGLSEEQTKLYYEIYPCILALEPFSYTAAEHGYDTLDDLLMAWGALKADYVEINNYFIIHENVNGEGVTLSLDSRYYCVWKGEKSDDKDEIRKGMALFEQECDAILAGFPNEASAYAKYLYLAVEVSKKLQYDYEFAHPGFAAPYSIVSGYAICQGYAELYQYLCARAGLWCRVVEGSSRNVAHGWNLVKLESGTYHVDITWADEQPGEPGGGEWMKYFMLTQDEILYDHGISDGTAATGR